MTDNKSALLDQVGGNHYKNQTIQPVELAFMLGGTPTFCKVAKYCTREKDDPIEQINKSIHCVRLEQELGHFRHFYGNLPRDVTYHTISLFTQDLDLLEALYLLYHGDYDLAIDCLEQLKERIENDSSV